MLTNSPNCFNLSQAFTYDSLLEDEILSSYPEVQLPSCFDLDNFQTLLLPTLENKPLDATALQGKYFMSGLF